METYAAYALEPGCPAEYPATPAGSPSGPRSAHSSLGALGQVAYHLLSAAGVTAAPWWITTVVACLPVAVLGMGAALAHLLHSRTDENGDAR